MGCNHGPRDVSAPLDCIGCPVLFGVTEIRAPRASIHKKRTGFENDSGTLCAGYRLLKAARSIPHSNITDHCIRNHFSLTLSSRPLATMSVIIGHVSPVP